MHITVMGQPTVILGTLQAASDLLDSRGRIQAPSQRLYAPITLWSRSCQDIFTPIVRMLLWLESCELYHPTFVSLIADILHVRVLDGTLA